LIRHDGANWVCLNGACASLISPDCPNVLGNYTADDVLLFGALVPLYGAHASTGAALASALRLAVGDFAAGVPSPAEQGALRPIAVVVCNESVSAERAANHLRNDLAVPAILGAGGSATTLDVVQTVTLPGGILLMSPRATASLASVASSGLVWRTCPSDALEGAALVPLIEQVATQVAQDNALTKVRVALVRANDVESTEIAAQVSENLTINGHGAQSTDNIGEFIPASYGDPDSVSDVDASGGYGDAIGAVTQAAALPDVIAIIGSTQAAAFVLPGIEASWPGTRKPRYVLSSGLQTKELLDAVRGSADLRGRVVGTAPGGSGANVDAFRQRFEQPDTPWVFGAPQAFDAFYALAFAAAVTPKVAPVGTELRAGLRAVLTAQDGAAPTAIDVGPSGISTALAALARDEALTLNGASAPLAFNTQTGDVVTDVQVWCVGTQLTFQSAGMTYSAQTAKLTGTLSCP
jgi:hypothetical protein